MSSKEQQIRDAIARGAAEWYVANRQQPSDATTRAAFESWLRSSPLHVEEYLKAAMTSCHLRAAVRAFEVDVRALVAHARAAGSDNVVNMHEHEQMTDELVPGASHPRRWLTAAAVLVAMAICASWLALRSQSLSMPRSLVTAHGEQRTWRLPDGTALSLNTDSAVVARFSNKERLVEVLHGQALFQVAHETGRRFRVTAGATDVVATGTEFDVRYRSAATQVTVVEGRVAVFVGAAPPPTVSLAVRSDAISVGAGQQVQIAHGSRSLVPAANIRQAVAWVQRQIVFDKRPLAEVAQEFNEYGAVPIVVPGNGIGELPISGVFNAYDTASFVAFLGRLPNVEVISSPREIRVESHDGGRK